ncbi:hypothetical protein [Pelagicoccus sp. SDUM812003]|uniref:hypothetical protein n=1 Tax=Pelagicoccus sp. SDUM812003 TaxID=3041267 RepID=UPI00280CE5E7|nr:hypothetical protein [Pelagicoccus sp. SDUM812003]MDQ8203919.1 hypothetical protein [Pelagicoccus sp. SDUM812003]
MDRIGSNPYLNTTRLYQQSLQQRQETHQSQSNASKIETSAATQKTDPSGFSSMFGDNELLKLQGNLEAIAQMAEHALKRFDG